MAGNMAGISVKNFRLSVIKRCGVTEIVSFDKVLRRITQLSNDLTVNPYEIAQKVCARIYDGVCTSELDELAAYICSSMTIEHPDYAKLASRIIISNHTKNTSPSFSETVAAMHGADPPLITTDLYTVVMQHKEKLNSYIQYERDYDIDYFGFKTLEKSYLSRVSDRVVERPQHLFMRVALGIHGPDIAAALETYDMMSTKHFVHATPTLFNAGTIRPQMSSCFLTGIEDSIDSIYECLHDCARISKYAGGIGLHAHGVRAKNSVIRGTNGKSTGIIPMLRVFNATARYVNQSGRRNGSISVYLEPWHADVMEFLEIRKNHGVEEERARDLFPAMWVPDLFMRRVETSSMWSLMCPDASPGLSDIFGDAFDELYEKYETEGRFVRQIPARAVWHKILESQILTGTPYILYKDHVNRKSNHANLGVIKCGNLCTEIVQYTEPGEIAVCNLASVCLPTFVRESKSNSPRTYGADHVAFDHQGLHDVVKVVTRNLNRVIDRNMYPVDAARNSNLRHRPIGIGIQGLADVLFKMKLAFEDDESKRLNVEIFETMCHAALEASCELAESEGAYESFPNSPASRGVLQCDMWNAPPSDALWNWTELRARIQTHGLRNSMLIAPMPTASTSQIMGFTEAFEPMSSNLYKRKTLAGEFIVLNRYLVDELIKLNLWTPEMRERLLASEGSVQNVLEIPEDLRKVFKTVWEISQRHIIDMAADRGPFVCQSQSMNLFSARPTFASLTSMHFYAWSRGLKTGMYYLRTLPATGAQKVTIAPSAPANSPEVSGVATSESDEGIVCRRGDGNDTECMMCSA